MMRRLMDVKKNVDVAINEAVHRVHCFFFLEEDVADADWTEYAWFYAPIGAVLLIVALLMIIV